MKQEDFPVNIRFVAQGMLKVAKCDVPDGIKDWPKEKVWEWAQKYFEEHCSRLGEVMAAIAYLGPEEDCQPGAVELDDQEEYPILVQSKEWQAFNQPDAKELV